jgi:aldehyde:ferredoxin oxidoreductase
MNPRTIYGYNGRILFIDLDDQTFRYEERDENFWRTYVGGGLASTFLFCEQTAPGIDPLGQDNLLIFSSSVVAGQHAPGPHLQKVHLQVVSEKRGLRDPLESPLKEVEPI